MMKIFEKLKGLTVEQGAKLIRESFKDVREQSHADGGMIDFDYYIDEGAENYFHFTCNREEVEGDEDVVNYESGYWGVMIEGNHYTHA
jgi:hypothetical protein